MLKAFKNNFSIVLKAGIISLSLVPVVALAYPKNSDQPMEEKFVVIDTDANGTISKEEFFVAYPNMKEAAFASIDKDNDGTISKEEWILFSKGHGKDVSQSQEKKDTPSIIMPDKK